MWTALKEVCSTSDTSNTVSSTMSYCIETNGGMSSEILILVLL